MGCNVMHWAYFLMWKLFMIIFLFASDLIIWNGKNVIVQPVLENVLNLKPFKYIKFHSGNGCDFNFQEGYNGLNYANMIEWRGHK